MYILKLNEKEISRLLYYIYSKQSELKESKDKNTLFVKNELEEANKLYETICKQIKN